MGWKYEYLHRVVHRIGELGARCLRGGLLEREEEEDSKAEEGEVVDGKRRAGTKGETKRRVMRRRHPRSFVSG
jgi:hypothetical protein